MGPKKPVILHVFNFDVITPSRAQGAGGDGGGGGHYGMSGAGQGKRGRGVCGSVGEGTDCSARRRRAGECSHTHTHTPSGFKGADGVDGTTSKHKHGLSGTFSHELLAQRRRF